MVTKRILQTRYLLAAALCWVLGSLTRGASALDLGDFIEVTVNKSARRTGLVRSSAEELRTSEVAPASRSVLPPRADISQRFPAPADQGMQQNCVAWAVGYAARSYYALISNADGARRADHVVSPAYIYNTLNRAQKGGADCQTPISFKAALDLLKARGAVPISVMRYVEKDCVTQARPDALAAHGARLRIRGYAQVKPENVRDQLSRGNPVIFAIYLTKDFDTWDTEVFARNGPFKSTVRDGREHAMVMTGYDDSRRAYKFINSWSNEWGEGGYGWIDYRAVAALWMEGWVLQVDDVKTDRVAPSPAPSPKKAPSRPSAGATTLPACTGDYGRWNNCSGNHTYTNGDTYSGEFSGGRRHGTGTFTFANGGSYTGEFKQGQRNGQGVRRLANGSVFSGEFKDGVQEGHATQVFVSGRKYVGEVRAGRFHGQGILYGPGGEVLQSGRWVEGKFER